MVLVNHGKHQELTFILGAKIKIMPDITNLNQMANPNDRVMHTWVNEVSKGIKAFEQQIALINQKLAPIHL